MSVTRFYSADYEKAAKSLQEAFAEDEAFLYTMNHKKATREQVDKESAQFFRHIVYFYTMYGECYTIDNNFGSIACWMAPGNDSHSIYKIFRSGLWKMIFYLSSVSRRRVLDFMTKSEEAQKEILGDRINNFWYLGFLGSIKSARRQGHSRKLIEHITKQADEAGIPAYLESSSWHNVVNVYRKMGFKDVKKLELTDGEDSATLYCMIREPVTPSPTLLSSTTGPAKSAT